MCINMSSFIRLAGAPSFISTLCERLVVTMVLWLVYVYWTFVFSMIDPLGTHLLATLSLLTLREPCMMRSML
jgi:hypothetical protein